MVKKISNIKLLVIVAAGNLSPELLPEIKKADYVIAADSASLWLINHGIKPNLAIGDFDSLSANDFNFIKKRIHHIKIFPPVKNYTDMHLAVKEVLKIKPDKVIIIGGTGSRLDHFLANVILLDLFLKEKIPAKSLAGASSVKRPAEFIKGSEKKLVRTKDQPHRAVQNGSLVSKTTSEMNQAKEPKRKKAACR